MDHWPKSCKDVCTVCCARVVCARQVQAAQRLREQVRQLERQREEEQVDRAAVINALAQRLEESQQQCAKLLQTGVCMLSFFCAMLIQVNHFTKI